MAVKPDIDPASPSAPVTSVGTPGPVGMKGGGGKCGSATLTGWPRNIGWREFTEIDSRPADEKEDAEIHAEANLGKEVGICPDGDKIRLGAFTVKLSVLKENSWVVKGTQADDLLSHEQGHYDLAGLYARKLMRELEAIRADDAPELQELVTAAIEQSRTDSQAISDRYDDETDHGRKADVQRRWKAAIKDAIDTGDPFKPPK